ncbi:unnamed protein product [Durusdinium trenchii]
MEEPPMLDSRPKQGSQSLLPDLGEAVAPPWPDKIEEEVQKASKLSLADWTEDKNRKEGHHTPTSGTQTPKTKAVSDANSDSGPDCMERGFSLSILDSLLRDHLEREDKGSSEATNQVPKPVVVVSSEVNPWSKTGGLGMVAGSYGYEFAMRGHRTMVVSPRYAEYDDAEQIGCAKVWLDGGEHEVQFFHLYQDLGDGNGTDYIFVGHDCFSREGLYCDPKDGKEYPDNLFRFSLLTVAALEAPLVLNIRGSTFGQDVLFIANDWQPGLLPVYHLYKYRLNDTYKNSRCVFVIHNIRSQGKYRLSKFPIDSYLGLPPEAIEFLQGEDRSLGNDCMNLLSAACLACDKVLTVSQDYAAEILNLKSGSGLNGILQQNGPNRMAGIINSIADDWNPRTDPHIPANYTRSNFDEGKAACKRELQKALGLHQDSGVALLGFSGRLCYQKWVPLITEILPWLLTDEPSGVLGRIQVILMGKGDDAFASHLSNAEKSHLGKVCGYVGFDPKVEHRLLAGCDFLLMPSRLPQMYAQAYGTVPIVHETEGFKASIVGLVDEQKDRETATGFQFCGFDVNCLKERMYQALEVYHKKRDLFKQIQINGLETNDNWTEVVSDANSEAGPENISMERVFSLSALDSLLQDPEGKAELRHQLELDELEDKRPKYTSHHLSKPVVVVSSEVNPWSKTGGLAMVAGSYGYEFAMRGHRTMVVSPRYGAYDGAHYVGYAKIWLDGREHEVQFFHLYQDLGDGNGTDYIFVGHDCFSRGGLYCDPNTGKEFPDNLYRFSLLTVAALEAPLVLNIRGSTFGQDVLFIANDWQTGLLPIYHLYKYRRNNTYKNSRCVFVIHNIGYQGKYRLSKFPIDGYLGLPPEAIQFLQGEDLNLGDDCMNLLSAACLASDRVLTVSPNYAVEIQSPEGGQGLHGILQEKGRQHRMAGILNGIADEWNPKTDPHIPVNYSIRTFEEGKAACKKELQRSLGLQEDPQAALLGFCGRLCYQKGVHLITEIIPWLLQNESSGVLGRVQIILMGKGDDLYANQLSNAENRNRGRVCGYVGFDPKVEHRMLAGCDFLLMPSQYEPCGLPQMYAQAYGTVPIVHETGGLKDSVSGLWDEERDRETATGFLFCGFDENMLMERMYQALEVFHKKKDLFKQIQINGLRKNYYWPQAIDEYERHLDWTLDGDAAVS